MSSQITWKLIIFHICILFVILILHIAVITSFCASIREVSFLSHQLKRDMICRSWSRKEHLLQIFLSWALYYALANWILYLSLILQKLLSMSWSRWHMYWSKIWHWWAVCISDYIWSSSLEQDDQFIWLSIITEAERLNCLNLLTDYI